METLLDKLRRHELAPTAGDGRRAAAVGRRAAGAAGAPPGRRRRRDRHQRAAASTSARWSTAQAPPAAAPDRRRRGAGRRAAPHVACRRRRPRGARARAARRPAGGPRAGRQPGRAVQEIADLGTIEPLDGGQRGRRHAPLQDRHHQHRQRPAGPVHVPRGARAGRSCCRSAPGYGFHEGAPGAPPADGRTTPATASSTTRPARPGASAAEPSRAAASRAPQAGRRSAPAPRPRRQGAGRGARVDRRCASRSRRSTSSSTWSASSSSRRRCWRRTASSSTRRCTSSSPPAWPTSSATRATCRKSVMSIRMIPMSIVFNRFPRMLRDLAAKLGKKVEFVTQGEATELDKGLVEKITDPLTHLVRNTLRPRHRDCRPSASPRASPSTARSRSSASHQGGSHRDRGARRRPRPVAREAAQEGARARHRRARLDDRPGGLEPDLRARLLHRRRRSPTCPAAASAWTWSRRTSPRSAARSRSTRPKATA